MAGPAGLITRLIARSFARLGERCRAVAARILRPRGIMAFIALVAAALTIAEMALYPARLVATTVLSAAHVAFVLALPWRPRPMAVGVLATFAVCCVLPDDGGSSLLFGTWLAIAVLGLYAKSWAGWLWPLAVDAVRWMKFVHDGIPADEYATLLMLFPGLYAVGRALAWRDMAGRAERDRLRYEQTRQRLTSMRRDRRAASRIHDAVTNNLAYMAMRLDYERSRGASDGTDDSVGEAGGTAGTGANELIDDLYRRTIDTLGEVRAVIDMLDGDDDVDDVDDDRDDPGGIDGGDGASDAVSRGDVDDATPGDVPSVGRLRKAMERGDRYLARLGFAGSSMLSDVRPSTDSHTTLAGCTSSSADGTIPAGLAIQDDGKPTHAFGERLAAVAALLRELYTNIAVYGDRTGEYRVIVHLDSDALTVDQVNDIAARPPLPDKPKSGRGLSLHRDRFAALGGSIRTSAEDGAWILHATLPLPSRPSHR